MRVTCFVVVALVGPLCRASGSGPKTEGKPGVPSTAELSPLGPTNTRRHCLTSASTLDQCNHDKAGSPHVPPLSLFGRPYRQSDLISFVGNSDHTT